MKTYIRFIIISFLKSFLNIFLIMFALVLILNLLSELDFFKNLSVDNFFPTKEVFSLEKPRLGGLRKS